MRRIFLRLTAVVLSIYLAVFIWFFFKVNPPLERELRGIASFKFENKDSLKGWEERIFKGKVLYTVKSDGASGYLNAYSDKSASAIIRWVKFNPRLYPMASWQWKVIKFPENKQGAFHDTNWLEKDDYAARFYIIFPRFPFFRLYCLEYVWDKNLPVGTVLVNPNFKNLKVIVAESGSRNQNQWVTIERNIYEDFKKQFGRTPGNVGAIAIMTDSDNSASSAEAQYNFIEVGYGK